MQLTLEFELPPSDPATLPTLPPLRHLWIPLLTGWATNFGLWSGTAPGILCMVSGYAGVPVEEEDAALCRSFGCPSAAGATA